MLQAEVGARSGEFPLRCLWLAGMEPIWTNHIEISCSQHTLPELLSAMHLNINPEPSLDQRWGSPPVTELSWRVPFGSATSLSLPLSLSPPTPNHSFFSGPNESYTLLLHTHWDPQHIWSCAKSASALTVHRHHGHGINQCHDQTDDGSHLHIHQLCLEYVETVVPWHGLGSSYPETRDQLHLLLQPHLCSSWSLHPPVKAKLSCAIVFGVPLCRPMLPPESFSKVENSLNLKAEKWSIPRWNTCSRLSEARMIQQRLSCLLLAMHCCGVQSCLATLSWPVLVIGGHLHGFIDCCEALGV